MASITCGNCKGTHSSVQEVKDCFGLGTPVSAQAVKAAQTPAPQGATPKQLDYAKALLEGRDIELLNGNVYERAFDLATGSGKFISKAEASALIEALKALPKAKAEPDAEKLADGIYLHNDHLFKIVHAVHGSGKQYAKMLDLSLAKPEWVYAGRNPLGVIQPDERLTAEKAKEFGLLYGMCVRCTKTLTLEESIHVGYGRTCAGHEGWWYPTKKELKDLTAAAEKAVGK